MTTETGNSKEEEEEEDDTMQNTVVLFSNTDKFVLQQVRISFFSPAYQKVEQRTAIIYQYFFMAQDMCVVCGSFGQGVEGQLLACAQCAQCYHPYCVNSKVCF